MSDCHVFRRIPVLRKFLTVSESHDPCGGILQLIALSSDPQIAHGMGLGAELRSPVKRVKPGEGGHQGPL